MNWKNWLTTLGSAFLGGAAAYLSTTLAGGLPSTTQAYEAVAGGAALAGLIAVVHLYQPVPGGSK
jgi:hypothetical protein